MNRRTSLLVRMLSPLVLGAGVALLGLAMLVAPQVRSFATGKALVAGERTLAVVAAKLAPPLAERRLDIVHEMVDGLATDRQGWVQLRVLDPAGRRLYPIEAAPLPPASDSLHHLAETVTLGDQALGRIEVALDIAPVLATANSKILQLCLIVTLIIGTFCAWMTIRLRNIVLEPVAGLARAADALASDGEDTPLPKASAREIDTLVRSFATMRERIHASRESALSQRNAELSRLLARERALRRETRLLEQVVLSTSAGIAIVECVGDGLRIRSVNQAMTELLDLSADLAIGQDMMRLLTFSSIANRGRLRRRRGHCAHGVVGEAELTRRDGSKVAVEASTARIEDPSEAVEIMGIVLRDISRAKAAETALRAECARAEAANRAKSAFVRTISHELRTPMNAITGIADVLSESALDAEQAAQVETISTAATDLVGVIDDILDLARIEAGRLTIENKPFDPAALVGRTARLLTPLAARKGLTLETDIGEGLPEAVLGDATRLRQCLVNLAGNAIKYTATGSIRLGLRRQDDRLHFEVEDTGPGITETERQRVFDSFERLERDQTRADGAGLGLAITRELVAAMEGTIQLESMPDVGTRLMVALPLRPAATTGSGSARHHSPMRRQPSDVAVPPAAPHRAGTPIQPGAAMSETDAGAGPGGTPLQPGPRASGALSASDGATRSLPGPAQERSRPERGPPGGRLVNALPEDPPTTEPRPRAIGGHGGMRDGTGTQDRATTLGDGSEPTRTILVVDDNQTNRMVVERLLAEPRWRVLLASGGEEALAIAAREVPDL
ncbi:MAG: ATP-binding protein, partial [Pseudomonadota bacterium]